MVRWVASGLFVLVLIAFGVATGFVLVENAGWTLVQIPSWLQSTVGGQALEVWSPILLLSWPVALVTSILLVWSLGRGMFRSRQDGRAIVGLERELAALRNLPFMHPAPLEDLPDDLEEELDAS